MNPREQTLATVLLGATLLVAGGGLGYFFLFKPYEEARAAEDALAAEIADLEAKSSALRQTAQKLAAARTRSLPADEALARREYTVALERMAEAAGVPKGYTINPKQADNSPRAVPEVAKGKPAYTRVAYELVFKNTDMWALEGFLKAYYDLGLLHQITAMTIKNETEPGAKVPRRNDLTVTITTEALLVDGAENRRTLLPVPAAVAAVGGGLLQRALAATPEAARGLRSAGYAPPYNAARDHTFAVLKDPFCGPLPPPPPFRIGKLADVKVKPDEKPAAVKVALSGDGAPGAKVTALVSGPLFAEGALKYDPKAGTIELPATSATEGTATVSVVAVNAEGKTERATFKVTVDAPAETVVEKAPTEDISKVILLIGVTPRSDGTAWARVADNANRTRYEVNVERGGIKVKKEYLISAERGWRTDGDHKAPAGAMHISDDFSKTNRLLRVVAVDGDGLIVADLQPGGPPKPPAKAPMPGKGPRPGPGAGAVERQGPGAPLAAVGGNAAVAVPQPKYYRWPVGQSLAALKPLTEKETAEVLKLTAATGPIIEVASTGN